MRRVRRQRNDYLTLEDGIFDSRIPVRSNEEFRTGIRFAVKLIGVSIIPKPRTKNEIVIAMRTVRTESRRQKTKKTPVDLFVSFDGIRITGKDNFSTITHSLNRIFYVSHDSLDLKIFSLIVRDENTFKCVVFKASKKTLAVNAVRTIGQAFELCQEMSASNNRTVSTINGKTEMINSTQNCHNILEHIESKTSSNDKTTINNQAQNDKNNNDDDDSDNQKTDLKRKCSSTSTTTTTDQNISDDVDFGKNELRTLLCLVSGKLDDMNKRIHILEQKITRLSTVIETKDDDKLFQQNNDKVQVEDHVFDDSVELNQCGENDNRLNEKLSTKNNNFNDKLSYFAPESILTPTPILPASKILYLGELY